MDSYTIYYDINWGALDHVTRAPQLMPCDYCVCVCVCVCEWL